LTGLLSQKILANAEAEDEEFCERASSITGRFYRRHIIPFAKASPQEQLDVSLLIGTTARDTANRLFVTHKTTVRRVAPYEAVGAGAMFAKMLLKRLWPDEWFDRRTAAILAAYVMYHVKESVPYCGKLTDICVLNNGKRRFMPWQTIRELEGMFMRYGKLERAGMLAAIASDAPRHANTVKGVTELFEAFRSELAAKVPAGLLNDDAEEPLGRQRG